MSPSARQHRHRCRPNIAGPMFETTLEPARHGNHKPGQRQTHEPPIRYINLLRTITGPIPGCGPAVAMMFGRWSILVPFAFADGWILILSLSREAAAGGRRKDAMFMSVRRRACQ
jgi:hypothetical protein